MEIVIKKHYIKESLRIINKYNEIVEKLNEFQTALVDNKQALVNLQKEIDKLSYNNAPELQKRQELSDIMVNYDKEVNKLHSIIIPYLSEMEQIKKESDILYKSIKENYPGYENKVLQEQIFKQIQELEREHK